MSHANKSRAKGISASSFFDLKAELSKQETDFAKAKAAGGSTKIIGGVKRPDKVGKILPINSLRKPRESFPETNRMGAPK